MSLINSDVLSGEVVNDPRSVAVHGCHIYSFFKVLQLIKEIAEDIKCLRMDEHLSIKEMKQALACVL